MAGREGDEGGEGGEEEEDVDGHLQQQLPQPPSLRLNARLCQEEPPLSLLSVPLSAGQPESERRPRVSEKTEMMEEARRFARPFAVPGPGPPVETPEPRRLSPSASYLRPPAS